MRFLKRLNQRRVRTAVGTLVLAFACGHITQTLLAERPIITSVSKPIAEPATVPRAPTPTLIAGLTPPPIMPERVAPAARPEKPAGCTPRLVVEAAPAATLFVDIYAPCHGLARANISQNDLTASIALDKEGASSVRLPALGKDPKITVAIAGHTLTATTEVSDADMFQHIALQWSGQQMLSINAYEFGAQKSQFGHVWAGAPKSPARASRGSGGFLTHVGDGKGKAFEIYSFPAGQSTSRGVIRLMAEAQVTRENCGKGVKATALQSGPFGQLRPTEVSMTLPDCDELGETVRLQNLFHDMRLARR